jgi:hypothetical protein
VVPQTISDVTIDSAVSVFYRWSADGFRLGCTLKKLFEISAVFRNLAVNLPLKQTFVSLTSAMTPPSVFTTAHCVSCRNAHFKLSSVVIRRDAPVNV